MSENDKFLLEWLSKEDVSAYGECRGPALDRLIEQGLAKTVERPTDWSPVSLTDKGYRLAADNRQDPPQDDGRPRP